MASADDYFSDFEDDELDKLYEKAINKSVKETITRRAVPVQKTFMITFYLGRKLCTKKFKEMSVLDPLIMSLITMLCRSTCTLQITR